MFMQMSEQNLMPSTDLQKNILDKCRTAESKQVCRICKQTKWRTNRRTGTDSPHLIQTSRWSVQVQSSKTKLCCFFFCFVFFVHWCHAMHHCRTGSDPNKEVLLNRNTEAKIRQKNVDFDKHWDFDHKQKQTRLKWDHQSSFLFFF